jgi:hypothetical protein
MALALVFVAGLLLAGEARAGTYRVAQCGWGLGVELDPTLPVTTGTAFSLDARACPLPPGSGPPGMAFEGAVAPDGAVGLARARWIAPSGTRFAGAHLVWFGTAQPGNWLGLGVDVGIEYHLLTYSFSSVAPAVVDLPIEGQAWAFEAFLQCLLSGPAVDCTRSTPSTMRVSGITFLLEDTQAPRARLGGALVAPGWHRGTVPLELAASDVGAGVAGETATIDGATVLSDAPACAAQLIENETRGTKMQPCPSTVSRSVEVDTTGLADGAHSVGGCATDFAGDGGCAPEASIEVDNSPPVIAFTAEAAGQVGATVSDRYSGVASGTISVRRADADGWTDLPTDLDREGSGAATLSAGLPDLGAGTYFLRVVATDVAGNASSAQTRVVRSAAEARGGATGPGGKAAGSSGKGPGRTGKAPSSGTGGRSSTTGQATHLRVRLVARGGGGHGRARAMAAWERPGPPGAWSIRGRAADRRAPDAAAGSGLTVDYRTTVEVHGRLTDARRRGVDGRPVTVVVRAVAGIGGVPERRRVVTDRGGRFGMRLPAGTSRRVAVSFHGGGGLAPSPRRSLALRVRASVSLAAEPAELGTGESVRLHGRVLLGPARVSRRGKIVAIQYLERATGRWRPALVVRTDAEGRFDMKYRFRYVTGVAEIRLRATAPAEGGWPFARGSSAPVTVTVRGR